MKEIRRKLGMQVDNLKTQLILKYSTHVCLIYYKLDKETERRNVTII